MSISTVKDNIKAPLNINKTPEEAYEEYKDLFFNSELSIKDIYIKIGVPQTQNTHYFYIREHAQKDGLNGYSRRLKLRHGSKPIKYQSNMESNEEREKYFEECYQEFLEYLQDETLSIQEILQEMGTHHKSTMYFYFRKRMEEDGINPRERQGKVIGSKVKKTCDARRKENEKLYEEVYQEYKKLFNESDLLIKEIYEKLNITDPTNLCGRYIRKRCEEDGLDSRERTKQINETKIKNNEKLYEEVYQEYKKLFLETDLFVKEIYEKLNITDSRKPCAVYIRKRCEEDGLNNRQRAKQIQLDSRVSDEEQKIRDELYVEYKKLFLETDLPIIEIHKKLGIESDRSPRAKYIRQKALNEGLNGTERNIHLRKKRAQVDPVKGEKLFNEYKKLFETTDYPIAELYEILDIKRCSKEYYYITKRSKEEGLNGIERRKRISKKTNILNSKNKKTYRQSHKRKYSEQTVQQIHNSADTLEEVFKQRNISNSTQKGYLASLYHWFDFIGDKYSCLKENIDYYIHEEDERIPMRERSIKQDLLGFRKYMINCDSLHTKASVRSYYSKITAIFRHYSIEVPRLPPVKMDKGYVSNYNDLPTHDMIRTACEQSSDVLKAVFLFMSSSGTAKAETLSITVRMFMEGCSEYLSEYPTESNMEECLKELNGRHDIVPLIYLRRLKTDKWYYTCCSPEASYIIINYLFCNNVGWEDKLFPFTSSLLLTRFQQVNDMNDWGEVGGYRRFRSHALRKFMASNIGLPRDQVDSFQGRSKDLIAEAYFKQDPRQLKEIYMGAMHNVMIYDNWGYEIENTPSINIDYNVPEKQSHKEVLKEEDEVEVVKMTNEPTNNINNSFSIADELLKYSTLLEKGLITDNEFKTIKEKLLGGII